ncbi:septal ring lytic transglycosylase RlpA family protein [Devosia sp. ZB163]|nr:septal ring lytic transglycosylase RlpA family protein [Devosia sp. ZB163]MDC9825690.1 septal ring lytic transglycosylase RlpA family protein [Devosia sp. ZB163]
MTNSALACSRMVASHYGAESGSVTANGERFTGKGMTAAHKTLPFGTKLRVTYRGKSVVVRINDRGPFVRGRHLDLSTAAARHIGMTRAGVATVCVEKLS